MTDIDAVALSPEERLAAELPRILNFYVLPPRVVGDKFWLHLANEILATLDAARADRDGLRGLPFLPRAMERHVLNDGLPDDHACIGFQCASAIEREYAALTAEARTR